MISYLLIGIGFFECKCGRKFCGFCQGDVPSKCHVCGETKNFAVFVTPGDKDAAGKEAKYAHHCAVCKGSGHCPIVGKASHSR